MAPRKVRAIGDLIKGLSVNEAEAQLLTQRRRAAKPLLKLLRSAMHNAVHNKRFGLEKLYVESVRVDQGPMLKRYLPRARGVATPIQRKMSHITIMLGENINLPSPRFKIVVPKKTKLPSKGRSGRKKTKEKTTKKETSVSREPAASGGFFKKVFSRKTGMGK